MDFPAPVRVGEERETPQRDMTQKEALVQGHHLAVNSSGTGKTSKVVTVQQTPTHSVIPAAGSGV